MSKKNQPLIISLVLILIIILGFVFILLPEINKIKATSEKLINEKNDLESKYQNKQDYKTAYKNLGLIKSNEGKILGATIQKNHELEFVTALEKIINDKNLTENISLSPPDKKNQILQNLNLTISLVGSFANIMQAINEIEKSPYYITIEKLEFGTTTVLLPAPTPTTTKPGEKTPPSVPTPEVHAVLSGYVPWQP